ncbi:hypothetical protein [Pseudonocardia acidicola]|uniref:Uncharacterized protein n=1 Tax=Pseudonocardia acidicola TaxID=2724939 RepID=A0ABX1SJT3_9PSEU|nr:hypothetical protein [Pseudonocardia acidicola]NMI01326.1 hypothetical protein [Pseudonocardia acidicola]
MTTVAHAPIRLMTCRGECPAAARYPAHHDRLLTIDTDLEELLALLELAVTWHELDYSDTPVLGPDAWFRFAELHSWTFPERAERAFSLALDIVGRGAAGPPPEGVGPSLASVIDFVRS